MSMEWTGWAALRRRPPQAVSMQKADGTTEVVTLTAVFLTPAVLRSDVPDAELNRHRRHRCLADDFRPRAA